MTDINWELDDLVAELGVDDATYRKWLRERLGSLVKEAVQQERDRCLWLLDGLPEKPKAKEIDELRGAIWKGTGRLFE